MSVRGCVCAALLVCFARPAQAQSVFTIDEAVRQAIDRNMTLLAERWNLTVADAAIVTARLRPNPVLSGGANSLDWLGTGFDEVNGAGPPHSRVLLNIRRDVLINYALVTLVPDTVQKIPADRSILSRHFLNSLF